MPEASHRVDDEIAPRQSPGKGMNAVARAVLSGLAGAGTVTLLNEGARRVAPHTPRMEVIGERALVRTLRLARVDPPRGQSLYRWTLASDVVSNTLYYSLAGLGGRRGARRRGALLGLVAGLGAAFLAKPLGLGRQPDEDAPLTQVLTVAWYSSAGLAAGATNRALLGGGTHE